MVHLKEYFSLQGGGSGAQVPDVRVCLHSMRQEVLQGCRITFSQIMDSNLKIQPHRNALWQLATSLGAACCDSVDAPTGNHKMGKPECNTNDATVHNSMNGAGQSHEKEGEEPSEAGEEESSSLRATHVVSLSRLTDKAKRAQELEGVETVSPDWLLASEIKYAHFLQCLSCLCMRVQVVQQLY